MLKKFMVLFLSLILVVTVSSCSAIIESYTTTKTESDITDETAEVTVSPSTAAESQASETTAASTALSTAASTVPAEAVISITPPDGWVPVEGSVLPLQYMKSTASFMVVHEVYFTTNDLDAIVEEAKGMFSEQFDNVTYIGDTTTVTIDGNDARNFIWTNDMGSVKFKYSYTYVKVGENIYSIVFADFAETYDSLSADFDKILLDIKFS